MASTYLQHLWQMPRPHGYTLVGLSVNSVKLVFSDEFEYSFVEPANLKEALTVRVHRTGVASHDLPYAHNHSLARRGDREMRALCEGLRDDMGDHFPRFTELYDQGVGSNSYLADVADWTGLSRALVYGGESSGQPSSYFTRHAKADAVEAIFGAVDRDCGDRKVVGEVMRRFGVFWPTTDEEDTCIEQMLWHAKYNGLYCLGHWS